MCVFVYVFVCVCVCVCVPYQGAEAFRWVSTGHPGRLYPDLHELLHVGGRRLTGVELPARPRLRTSQRAADLVLGPAPRQQTQDQQQEQKRCHCHGPHSRVTGLTWFVQKQRRTPLISHTAGDYSLTFIDLIFIDFIFSWTPLVVRHVMVFSVIVITSKTNLSIWLFSV